MRYRNLEERLIANSVLSEDTHLDGDPCWLWIGHCRPNGYGTINIRENGRHKAKSAHRTAYEELVGPIPEGWEIDHKCCVLNCINPNHLEPVPNTENIRRRDERKSAWEHCPINGKLPKQTSSPRTARLPSGTSSAGCSTPGPWP